MFRSDPGKFKKLKHECHDFFKQCDEFLILVTSLEVMVINIEAVDLPQIIDQVCNWQVQLVMHDQIVGNVFCMITILFFPFHTAVPFQIIIHFTCFYLGFSEHSNLFC